MASFHCFRPCEIAGAGNVEAAAAAVATPAVAAPFTNVRRFICNLPISVALGRSSASSPDTGAIFEILLLRLSVRLTSTLEQAPPGNKLARPVVSVTQDMTGLCNK
jgi:hypothetical protein